MNTSPGARAAHPGWPWAQRMLTLGFLTIAGLWLAAELRSVQWVDAAASLSRLAPASLWTAAALTVASYAVYSCFDLLGRRYTGHQLTSAKVLSVSFVGYACGLALGVAGLGLRFRLYTRLGMRISVVAGVYAVSLATNWLGFLVLAGGIFAAGSIELPASWSLGALAVRALGWVFLCGAAGYLALCARAGGGHWHFRGRRIGVPTLRFALLQCAMSVLNWLLIAALWYVLLQQQVAFPTVLGVLMVSAMAVAVADLPGGFGVKEAVFLAMLGGLVPVTDLLAAFVAYRAIYYLVPLMLAALVYLRIEARPG